jgi:hypothetical protein
MKKRMRVALIALASLSGITMVTLLVSAAVYSPAYMARILLNGESKITDYRIFPERAIARSDRPYTYEVRELAALPESDIGYRSDAKEKTARLRELLAANGTTSCIVVHGERVREDGERAQFPHCRLRQNRFHAASWRAVERVCHHLERVDRRLDHLAAAIAEGRYGQ